MADKVSIKQRHYIMSRVRSINTKPEIKLRKALFEKGFRYRVNVKTLPGKPDIVLPKYRTAIFVNGCFWHGHSGCKYYTVPETNVEFWVEKVRKNKERDAVNVQRLESLSWSCVTIWECELRPKQRETTLQRLLTLLRRIEAPVLVQELRKTASYANSYSGDDLLMAAEEEEEYSS